MTHRRGAPIGSPRERAYRTLSRLQSDGFIARYIASQHPTSRQWGFRVTMPDDGGEYWFLPKEVLAFGEGIAVAIAATSPPTGAEDTRRAWLSEWQP